MITPRCKFFTSSMRRVNNGAEVFSTIGFYCLSVFWSLLVVCNVYTQLMIQAQIYALWVYIFALGTHSLFHKCLIINFHIKFVWYNLRELLNTVNCWKIILWVHHDAKFFFSQGGCCQWKLWVGLGGLPQVTRWFLEVTRLQTLSNVLILHMVHVFYSVFLPIHELFKMKFQFVYMRILVYVCVYSAIYVLVFDWEARMYISYLLQGSKVYS